jgi:hypothetical protein
MFNGHYFFKAPPCLACLSFFFINLLLISFTFYLEKLVKSMIHLGEIPGKMAIEGEIVRYFFFIIVIYQKEVVGSIQHIKSFFYSV